MDLSLETGVYMLNWGYGTPFYIGVTGCCFISRFEKHIEKARSGQHTTTFQPIYDRMGEKNLRMLVLDIVNHPIEIKHKEECWFRILEQCGGRKNSLNQVMTSYIKDKPRFDIRIVRVQNKRTGSIFLEKDHYKVHIEENLLKKLKSGKHTNKELVYDFARYGVKGFDIKDLGIFPYRDGIIKYYIERAGFTSNDYNKPLLSLPIEMVDKDQLFNI